MKYNTVFFVSRLKISKCRHNSKASNFSFFVCCNYNIGMCSAHKPCTRHHIIHEGNNRFLTITNSICKRVDSINTAAACIKLYNNSGYIFVWRSFWNSFCNCRSPDGTAILILFCHYTKNRYNSNSSFWSVIVWINLRTLYVRFVRSRLRGLFKIEIAFYEICNTAEIAVCKLLVNSPFAF